MPTSALLVITFAVTFARHAMKSGPLYVGILAASAAMWTALYLELAFPLSPSAQMVVAPLPCLALIWFGCWSLGTISINLIRLNESTEAAAELQRQEAEARADLTAKGLADVFEPQKKG